MNKAKKFIFDHFELLLIFLLIMSAELINFYVIAKLSFLNFFYLPVLLAGYFLGRKHAIMTSAASVCLIILFFVLWPTYLTGAQPLIDTIIDISVWAFFLIFSGFLVGALYEQNQIKIQQLKLAYVGILEILSKYLESYDRHTKGHSVRVSKLATEIAISMHLPRPVVENVRVAGLLHDIGKIDVSIDLIEKSAALSKEEKDLVDMHSEHGAQILGLVGNVLEETIPIIRAHHDSYVGSDYGQVPLEARIVSVADCYDAFVTDRPYRKAITPWQAIEEIEKESGKKFDPQVVNSLKHVLSKMAEETVQVS